MKKFIAVATGAAMILTAFPAFASNNVTVINSNDSKVVNEVVTSSNTGGNSANGGAGGDAGAGGSVISSQDDNTGGNGGAGGKGGEGGTVITGDATSGTMITNKVGYNETVINGCHCDLDDILVINKNKSKVKNKVTTYSDTGNNTTDGGAGGMGSSGGSVISSGDNNIGGNGGGAGAGGAGGAITTGHSTSLTEIVNRIGKNITRINP